MWHDGKGLSNGILYKDCIHFDIKIKIGYLFEYWAELDVGC